jgi:hypothetical protein
MVEQSQNNIITLIKEATGSSDVLSIDFKDLDNTTRKKIDFTKVRGSVRMMSGKIKTFADVSAMKKQFIALRIP